jgi:carboxymethylenebutenolidase
MKKVFLILFSILLAVSAFPQKKHKQRAGAKSKQVLSGTMVSYMSSKDSVQGYMSKPEGEGPFPALILVHEWWGLDDWVKANADKFAKMGYLALCVDLYRGKVTDDPKVAQELSRTLDQQQGVRDVIAAYNYLKSVKDVDTARIGSIGWCMGGTYSLQSAIYIPDLKGAVVCYGGLTTDPDLLGKIQSPVLGIFGRDDKVIPPDKVQAFETAMNNLHKDIKVIEYPGVGHAFLNQNTVKKQYSKKTAEEAWNEIYAFLDKNVKTGNRAAGRTNENQGEEMKTPEQNQGQGTGINGQQQEQGKGVTGQQPEPGMGNTGQTPDTTNRIPGMMPDSTNRNSTSTPDSTNGPH